MRPDPLALAPIGVWWDDATMAINTSSVNHIRLTVTDIDRSRAFYEGIFDWPVAIEMPADTPAEDRGRYAFLYGGVIYDLGYTLLGLRPVSTDAFDENRTGLDHLSLAVGSPAELEDAIHLLDGLGVDHGGIKDIGSGLIVEFRDPDNIALELFAAKVSTSSTTV
ncbi:VOC family protein [Arthrobacter sp.]|uniref:VOC family protein n=1 Tax=Arthrobacter sp. TaxID=1667 RepID=UPI0025877821|nr:VOC family protein [Arthrobacter sp.]